MGIAFVLLFWAVGLGALAVVTSALLGFGIVFYLRKVTQRKRLITTVGFTLPFLCVVYAGLWFFAYYTVNDLVFHHDPGLGDGWYTNIGNGYAIDMIDVTDQGIVHPTMGQMNGLNSAGSIRSIRRLQISSPYLFGTQDSHGFEHLGQQSEEEDVFFSVDTRGRKQTNFVSEANLRAYALARGATLDLQPIAKVYGQYRFGVFDYFAFSCLLLVPLAALLLLLRATYRRKHRFLSALLQNRDTDQLSPTS